jgi:hypothetical protein
MKTKPTFSLLVAVFLITSFNCYAQKPDFAGEWKLNREKTVLADNQLFLSKVTIQIKGDSLFTTRVYENGMGEEYPFDENLTLDGKDCKITIYDMPRTSKAFISDTDGSINVESKTTFYGDSGEQDMIAKEVWKIDPETKMLTVEFTNKVSDNETTGINYYTKADI